jgi:hypothetical protein
MGEFGVTYFKTSRRISKAAALVLLVSLLVASEAIVTPFGLVME